MHCGALSVTSLAVQEGRRLKGATRLAKHEGVCRMFTIWFTEGGRALSEREWSIVPRVGDNITLRDSTGLFEVIRVNLEEREDSSSGLVAHVSLRASTNTYVDRGE